MGTHYYASRAKEQRGAPCSYPTIGTLPGRTLAGDTVPRPAEAEVAELVARERAATAAARSDRRVVGFSAFARSAVHVDARVRGVRPRGAGS
jgi:hypothetical protein